MKKKLQRLQPRKILVEFELDPEYWSSYDDTIDELTLEDVFPNLSTNAKFKGVSYQILSNKYTKALDFLKKFYNRLKKSGMDSSFGMTLHIMWDDKKSIGQTIKSIISGK